MELQLRRAAAAAHDFDVAPQHATPTCRCRSPSSRLPWRRSARHTTRPRRASSWRRNRRFRPPCRLDARKRSPYSSSIAAMRGTSVASRPKPTIRMTTQVTPAASRPPDPAAPFAWERAPWGWVLTCAPLARLGRHGFTARDLDPGRGATPDAAWAAIAGWLGVPAPSLWRLDQVHGCRALRVDASALPAGEPLPSADAAITTRTDVAVAVKAADCVPILLAHPAGAVAAVHAGWRGTAQGIAGTHGRGPGRRRRRIAARHRRRDRPVDRPVLLRGRSRGPRDVPRRGLRRDRSRSLVPAGRIATRDARARHVALEPRSAGRRRPRSGQRPRRRPVHGDAQRLVLVVSPRRPERRPDARGHPPGDAAQARLRGRARTSRSSAWRTRLTSVSDVNGFSSRSTLRPSCSPRLPG